MNYLDIIIAVPLLYGLIKGFSNGIIKEVTSLLGLFIGVYVAVNFSEFLEPKLINVLVGYQEFAPILAFGVLFLVSVLSVKVIGFVIDKLTKALALGVFSSIFGGFFGFLKVVVIFSFLLFFITDYKFVDEQTKKDSVLLDPLTDVAKIITPQLKKHHSILNKIDKGTKKVKEKLNPE